MVDGDSREAGHDRVWQGRAGEGGAHRTQTKSGMAWELQHAECRVQQVQDEIVHVLQNEGRFGLTTPEKEE